MLSRLARLIGLFSLIAPPAFAEPLPVTLLWRAPEGCPQHAEVWARLSERLGRVPSTPSETAFAARGLVERAEKGWRLSLQTLSQAGAGTREFTAGTCDELTRLAIVALSVAIDPMLEPPPEVVLSSLWLAFGPKTTVGVLPFPSVGLSGSVMLALRPVSFTFTLETALSQRIARDDGKALTVALPIGGGLDACLGLYGSRVSLLGCANLQVALIVGEAQGVLRPRPGFAALLSLGPRAEFRVLLHSRVSLRLGVDGSFALLRPSFVFADGADGYAVSFFSVAGALGVEFRVW